MAANSVSESVPTYSGLIALTGVAQAHAVIDHLQLCGTSQIYRGGSHSSQRRFEHDGGRSFLDWFRDGASLLSLPAAKSNYFTGLALDQSDFSITSNMYCL